MFHILLYFTRFPTFSENTVCSSNVNVSISVSHPCEVHAQFELGEQVEDDAPLVVQDAQVLLLVVLCIRYLFRGADVF